jgi:hypothetical protein
VLPFGREVTWLHPVTTLPDPVRLLEILADVCA